MLAEATQMIAGVSALHKCMGWSTTPTQTGLEYMGIARLAQQTMQQQADHADRGDVGTPHLNAQIQPNASSAYFIGMRRYLT